MGTELERKGADRVSLLAGFLMDSSTVVGVAIVTTSFAACGTLCLGLGTATVGAKYWFLFPIMLAAARFRWLGALIAACAATVLTGPLLPASVPLTTQQELSSFLVRGALFIVMGQVLAAVFALALSETGRQRQALKISPALSLALLRGEFVVWYQPVVDVQTGSVVGAEALVRWNHPSEGLIAPGDFIASAEDTGIIIPLGAYVLETACEQLAIWRSTVLTDIDAFKLAVNISAVQLATPDLFDRLERILRETGIPPEWLYLEITETAAIADLDHIARRVTQIQALGVRIAIDDFGIGHNSLRHLHRLPCDVVKIDQSFVAALDRSDSQPDMVAAVIALARTLGLRTVAEGVETVRQAERLRELGADLAQGYLYGRPQPASAITPHLAAIRNVPRGLADRSDTDDAFAVPILRWT